MHPQARLHTTAACAGITYSPPLSLPAPPRRRYVYSLYWGVVTFATVGFGDLHAQGVAEALFFIVYITINLALYAYILGTITQLVVKSDSAVGTIREKMHALESYAQVGSPHRSPHLLLAFRSAHDRLLHATQPTLHLELHHSIRTLNRHCHGHWCAAAQALLPTCCC
jgi:hypothetical protein